MSDMMGFWYSLYPSMIEEIMDPWLIFAHLVQSLTLAFADIRHCPATTVKPTRATMPAWMSCMGR